MTTQIAVRLPDELLARVDSLAASGHGTRTDVFRRAVETYLYRLECERDAAVYEAQPLSDAELALADDPAAWKATPKW